MASRFFAPFGRGPMGSGDPFAELRREMNRLFDDTFRGSGPGGQGASMAAPRVDVHETDDAIEISAELPGVRQEDVDLRLEGELLTIRGEKRQERTDRQAHILERSYGSFQRSIQLPFAPDPDQVRASFENGVLHILLPKAGQQEKSRRIEIGSGRTIEGSATSQSVADGQGGTGGSAQKSSGEAGGGPGRQSGDEAGGGSIG